MVLQKLKYILFFFIFTSNLYAQNIFEHQNPYYSSEQINHISFYNNIGYAVGNSGLILKTSDNGVNWSEQNIQSSANLKKVLLTDISSAFIYDDSSRIFKTTNSGNNWIYVSSIFDIINDMFFLNQNSGFVVTDNVVYKTANSGNNWVSFLSGNSLLKFLTVNFIDSQTGFISAVNLQTNYTLVLKTNNGGANWTEYNTTIDGYNINNIRFVNSSTGYCAGPRFENLYVIKTTNGGVNWFESPTSYNSFTPNNLHFENVNTGYISSISKLIKTTNGGNNWFDVLTCSGVQTSYFKNDSAYFFADLYSRIFFTNNRGLTFDTLLGKNNNILNRLQVIDGNYLWCNGYNYSNYKSTNSGLNWTYDNNSNLLKIRYSVFSDVNTGYAIANRGTMYKTTNFGNNWSMVFDSPNEIFSIALYNNQYLWGFGINEIFKSNNGGSNWITIPNTYNINSGKFFDEQNGICFNDIYLFRTSDGGNNFIQITNDYVSDFHFINNTTGYIVVNQDSTSTIKQTTNGGTNWIQKSVINRNINRIKFINFNTGYLLTYDRIYRSTNSGTNWKYVEIPSQLRAFGFDFATENTGWLCGDNSMIIKIINGSSIFVEEDPLKINDFRLFQNYPNPFNSETIIKFTISKPGFTTLKIFDIQGREITTLVNQYLNSQTYAIKFNPQTLSSGIYFYTINHNGITATKRIVLLK